ncbi:MAG: M24 family metallopeptidase, partial [Pseudomonadota bacterium]
DRGDQVDEQSGIFAAEVRDLIREHGGGNARIAADKVMIHGLRALEAAGFTVFAGEELTEKARSIKGPDEIKAMRCACHACEVAVTEMERVARDGVPGGNLSEDDIWAVLHAENIRRGGEWIETRLLTSGPRTNPWFQECGPRVVQNNEILAFDTDLISSYGICCDISRTWWIGELPPRPDMVYAMQHAYEHIMTNMEMLKPGVSMRDLSLKSHRLDEKYRELQYGCLMHGVGLCDEWPLIRYPDQFIEGAFDYEVEAGMVFCAEALVGEVGGDFSIKLEDQVLVTEDGFENLTKYPFDPALMGLSS